VAVYAFGSGSAARHRIDDGDDAPIEGLPAGSVGRHWVGIAEADRLQTASGHPVGLQPGEDRSRSSLRKL
jgi:hypothetical protein